MTELTKEGYLRSIVVKQDYFSSIGIKDPQTLRQIEFWPNALQDYSFDPITQAKAAIFNLYETREGHSRNIASLSVVESPKVGSAKSADTALVHLMPNGDIFLFAGDGVRYFEEPPVEVLPLLERFGCVDRPDDLPGAILRSEISDEVLLQASGVSRDGEYLIPVEFFKYFDYYLYDFYRSNGIDPDSYRRSQLPSITGVAALISEDRLHIASIGDPVTSFIDITNIRQNILPRQNVGIDEMTRRFVNKMLQQGEVKSVSEALKSLEFRDWIIFTFNEKINNVVSVVNGKDFRVKETISTSVPLSWISELTLGSDGLTLGLKSLEEKCILEFGESSISAEALLEFAARRQAEQKSGFSESECLQDKNGDDISAINVKFINRFRNTKLGRLI